MSHKRIAASTAGLALVTLLLASASGCDDGQAAEAERLRADLQALQAEYQALTGENERLSAQIEELTRQKAEALAERVSLEARLAERLPATAEAHKEPPLAPEPAAPRPEDMRLQRSRERLEKLAGTLFARDDYGVALAVALVAAQLGSEDPETHFQIGFCQAAAGQHREAVHSYEQALGILGKLESPDSGLLKRCLSNLGIACARTGRAQRAEGLYARALEVDPEFAVAHFNLGLLYADQLNRPDDAIVALRKHILHGGARSATARELILKLQAAEGTSPPPD